MVDSMDTDMDKIWMKAIAKNDYVSYHLLFNRYYGTLCQYVYGLLLDKADAEDVVQELFLNLWKNRRKIEINESVSAYLYAMARHLTLNLIRSRAHEETLRGEQEQLLLSYEDNHLEEEEFRIALYDCIDRLPGRSREVLLLHRVDGLKQKEIADKLSISVKTIKNLIWISLQRLRKCLEAKGVQ